jgi:hypothetical protein
VKKLIFLFWGIMLAVAMVFAQTPAMAQSVPSVPATQEQAVEQQVAEQQEAAAQQVEEATEQLAQAAEEEAAEELAQAPEQQEEAAEEPVQVPEQQEEAAEEPVQAPEQQEEAAEEPVQVPEQQEEAAEEPVQAPEEQEEAAEEEPQVPEEEEQVPEEEEPQVPEEEPQVPEELPWTYIFEDPARGTELRVNTDSKTFQFIASDGYDSGVVEAEHMIVYDTSRGQFIFIRHGDSEIRLFAFAVGGEEDRCSAFAIDRETGQGYRLVAPPVHFMGRIFHSWRMASPLGAVSPR